MNMYFTADLDDLTTTRVKVAEAVNVDRMAHFQEYGDGDTVISFTENGDRFGLVNGAERRVHSYVIPAGEELWVGESPSSQVQAKVQILVTSIGR